MSPTDRSSRSSLIFSAGNQLLHAETVQSPEEFGGLQQDINFKLARRIKNELDKEINGKNSCSASPSSESCSNSNHKKVAKAEMLGYLSVEEMNSLFAKLTKINRRLLSLV